jgi:hypothetical protein
MNLRELFDTAANNVPEIFKEMGELSPMWHVVSGNEKHDLIVTPWSSADEKYATIAYLKQLFAKMGVRRFVFICEAWSMTTTSMAEVRRWAGRIAENEDRREIISIQAEDRDGSHLHGWYYILRPEHGPPKLSPLQMSKADKHEGQLQGLLT